MGVAALGVLLLVSHCWCAPPAEVERLFLEGNKLYDAGRFAEAAETYEKCRQAGGDGADVLYNLGNAYARQGEIGRCLAAYHAALRLAPRDEELLLNIRQISTLHVETPPHIPRSWLATAAVGFLDRRTLNELIVLALLVFVGCSGLGFAVLMRYGSSRRLLAALCCCAPLLLLTIWAAAAKYSREELHAPAFICVEEATMRSGPGEHFEITGVLGDGARAEPLREAGMWREIALPTGKRAWVRRGELARM